METMQYEETFRFILLSFLLLHVPVSVSITVIKPNEQKQAGKNGTSCSLPLREIEAGSKAGT